MLLKCCLYKRHHTKTLLYLLYLCICLDLGLFMSNLSDLFFIFTLIFIMINRMNTDTCSFDYFVEYVHYFWMITWIKNVNNFQIAKVQSQGVT